ncbi:heat shock 70 kDa protein 12B isoform X1 [Embiotoca jacksoni]|uniref:heat shock 70 kDa protein 12B isoform X1 n=1 Tax=Embiotoca jacksoni TaxID=100190 RepID=UPI0037048638
MADVVQPDPNSLQIPGENVSTPSSPAIARNDCSITPLTPSPSPRSEVRPRMACPFSVVVAIDFGTTSSGYAYSFTQDSEAIHMMKRWEGGDPGVANQKSPTCLLLTPDLRFHSFGFAARDFYHDLDPEEARHWLYFDKFKMKIHSTSDLTMETELEAVNGRKVRAIEVFAHALRFFREHTLKEVKDQSSSVLEGEEIRWVITVPAVWRQPAKQFMREAAYLAGLVSPDCPEQLLIALEPEAASIYCRKLRLHQVIDLSLQPITNGLDLEGSRPFDSSFRQAREQLRRSRHSRTFLVESGTGELWSELQTGDRYVVADCGGGTVDLTVHQIEQPQGTLKELYKASGGPYGAVGVDLAFEAMLCQIFGEDFIQSFKAKRPAAWVDLTIAFEARKRTASPGRTNALNISLPFSFIDYYKRHRGQSVEAALRRSNMNFVKWSSQGMLRLTQEAMNELFQPTIINIVKHIEELMVKPEVRGIRFLFLVGGFAESPMLQKAVQKVLGRTCRIIIPHDVGLTILKGAVLFGLDPTVVRHRRDQLVSEWRPESRSNNFCLAGQSTSMSFDLRRRRAEPVRGGTPPSGQTPRQRRTGVVHRRPGPLRLRGPVGGSGRGREAELHARSPGPAEDHRQHLLQRDRRRHVHLRPRRQEVRDDNFGPAGTTTAAGSGGRSGSGRSRRPGEEGDQSDHAVWRHGDQSHSR